MIMSTNLFDGIAKFEHPGLALPASHIEHRVQTGKYWLDIVFISILNPIEKENTQIDAKKRSLVFTWESPDPQDRGGFHYLRRELPKQTLGCNHNDLEEGDWLWGWFWGRWFPNKPWVAIKMIIVLRKVIDCDFEEDDFQNKVVDVNFECHLRGMFKLCSALLRT